MKVVYYAIRPIQVGASLRKPGDLIPEASEWPYLDHYVGKGDIAPVLVATLPEAMQEKLAAWEMARERTPDIRPAEESEPETEAKRSRKG